MSDYGAYDEPPRRSYNTRIRPRGRNEPEYVEETVFVERGKGPPPRDLVFRTREESIEDIPRAFPPPQGRGPRGGFNYNNRNNDDYDPPYPRRARSQTGPRRQQPQYDDDYDDYAGPAGGAGAGYAAGRGRNQRYNNQRPQNSRDNREYYYSDDDESPPPRRDRRKSGIESAADALGLGGIVGALTGQKSRSRSRNRDDRREGRSRAGSRSRSRDRQGKSQRQWRQAANAAVIAGLFEAVRSRNEPGPWTGQKGKRIITAAVGAGGLDKLIDTNPDENVKRHLVEAVIGGLAANRLANGPAATSADKERGRSRSRSQSVGGRFRSSSRGRSADRDSTNKGNPLQGILAGGALATAGKAIWDHVNKSKSRGRSRSSSRSDRSPPPGRRNRDGRRSEDNNYDQPRGQFGPAAGAVAAQGGQENYRRNRGSQVDGPRDNRGSNRSSSSTSSSSETSIEDLEDKRKRMRGKEYVTAALASIATIHAAHGVYQSMEASDKRHKQVAAGELSPEEARKKRSKAWLQDAAAVGIAALGIKGAYSEWKEMNEQRHTIKELEERKRKRAKREQRRLQQMQMGGMSSGGGGGRQGYGAPGYGPPAGGGGGGYGPPGDGVVYR